MKILYDVIGDPLVVGSDQITFTLSIVLLVVTVTGGKGIYAHNNVSTSLY